MLDDYRSGSAVLEAPEIPAEALRARPLDAATVRVLRYMEGVESYTLFYLKSLLATSAAHEPEIAAFLARWLYEETGHGLAIARLLAANGTPIAPRPKQRESWRERITAAGSGWVSRVRRDFVAVHMVWGAINELTAVTSYRQLARRVGQPLVADLCTRLARDEARHFAFYFDEARRRLGAPGTQRLVRWLVRRFWQPVGNGIHPPAELQFLTAHLFSGDDGVAALRRADVKLQALPGMAGVPLLEAWAWRNALAPARQARAAAERGRELASPHLSS
jgi:Fatty acid desaturase